MKLGIVGLPNVGKSTLFNAITAAGAESANYPFCTIEPNIGSVAVPDKRLDVLAKMYDTESVIPAVIDFVDIAGLVKGASKGEGLGNKFLSNIREVDAIINVVRCFDDDNIVHVHGKTDPANDIETINLELVFSDLEILERRIDKTRKAMKGGEKKLAEELNLLERIKAELEKGVLVRSMNLSEDELDMISDIAFITKKPVIYAANVSEDEYSDNSEYVKTVKEIAASEGSEVIIISAKIEEEIAKLDEEESREFLAELGMEESGLDRLIRVSYSLLGLISFLTAGKPEVRAWTIPEGTKAPKAAGKIHTDFERGFIRAEVVRYDDLTSCGSIASAREKGLIRIEGKDYTVKDGDVIHFRFNV